MCGVTYLALLYAFIEINGNYCPQNIHVVSVHHIASVHMWQGYLYHQWKILRIRLKTEVYCISAIHWAV